MNLAIRQTGLNIKQIHRALNFDNRLQSKNSATVYSSVLGKFGRYLDANGIPWEAVDKQVIIDYMLFQKKSKLKNVSINTSIKALKRMYAMLIETGHAQVNPVQNIAYYKEPEEDKTSSGKWLNEEQLRSIYKTLRAGDDERHVRDYALFNFMVLTGLRANEVCHVKTSDIIYRDGTPVEILVTHAKGDKERKVELNAAILEPVFKYHEMLKTTGYEIRPDDFMFLTLTNNRYKTRGKLSPHTLFSIIKRIGRESGLDIHPHNLRHTFATHCIKRGASLIAVKNRMGHSSIAITESIYIHDDNKCLEYLNFDF